VIQVGDLDPWTFQATQNDGITVSIGEVSGSGTNPNFTPWIRLRGPDGSLLDSQFGSSAAQIDVRAPLTGTYTVLVANADADFQVGPGNYVLTVKGLTASGPPPVVTTFTANPSTIATGKSSKLSWITTKATTVSISGVAGTQAANGSVSVNPALTTTYTLTATGPGGTSTSSALVAVCYSEPQVTSASGCPVEQLPPPPLTDWETGVPPDHSLISPDVDSDLHSKVLVLTDRLLREDHLKIERQSGYRPVEYQCHFYQLRKWFDALVEQKRKSPAIETQCAATIKGLNDEIGLHGIRRNQSSDSLGGKSGAPVVNPPALSNHTIRPALAIDLGVSTLSLSQLTVIDSKASDAGVVRPCRINDPVHFQLVGTHCDRPLVAHGSAHSPVAILLTSPDGRRIGFDAASGTIVNDFGESGYYSGLESEPQEVVVSDVADGVFTLSGVGTGSGPYRLDLDVYPSSADGTDQADVIIHTTISGTTAPNEPLKSLVAVAPKPETEPVNSSRHRAARP
jgi:hypothetical protein